MQCHVCNYMWLYMTLRYVFNCFFSDHLCSKFSNIDQTTCSIGITVVFIADVYVFQAKKSVNKTFLRFDKRNHRVILLPDNKMTLLFRFYQISETFYLHFFFCLKIIHISI